MLLPTPRAAVPFPRRLYGLSRVTRDAGPMFRWRLDRRRRRTEGPPIFAGTPRGELTDSISAAMVHLYGRFYGHDRTSATTDINDNVVVCILERTSSA